MISSKAAPPSVPPEALVSPRYGGVHLRDTVLWFDAPRPRDLCFVSHALVTGGQRHARVLASQLTSELLQALHGARRRQRCAPRVLAVPLRQPFALGELSLELFAAEGLPGASALRVQRRGRTVFYCGIDAMSHGTPPEPQPCEVLVLNLGSVSVPPTLPAGTGWELELTRRAEQALERGLTPVMLCSPLGVAQQLAMHFLQRGYEVQAHAAIRAVSAVLGRHALGLVPPELAQLRRILRGDSAGPSRSPRMVLWPDRGLRRSGELARMQKVCLIPANDVGEATTAPAERRWQTTLSAYARACNPACVVLCGDPPATLVDALREGGRSVKIHRPARQLRLFDERCTAVGRRPPRDRS